MNRYQEGAEAKKNGKRYEDNPYITGYTKLGSIKLSEEGEEWLKGWNSISREATKKEIADAEDRDVSRFRKKPNRYYR